MEDVTSQLDEQESYWRGFALRLYNFSDVVLNSLRPVPFSSPTETVMNYIVQENNRLPMQSFLMTLKKMERNDLIEALKEFFERKIFLDNSGRRKSLLRREGYRNTWLTCLLEKSPQYLLIFPLVAVSLIQNFH